MNTSPLVSVVVPTRGRPHLVPKAVLSALAQTIDHLEVMVVVDGPDESTVVALEQIDDPRVRVTVLPTAEGYAAALNAGVKSAHGEWLAFLDDDDEWMPRKLELQLRSALESRFTRPIVSGRIIAQTSLGEVVRPRRLPQRDEPLSDYLLAHDRRFEIGAIAAPTIFTRTDLAREHPFRDVPAHVDWDWLLRVSLLHDVGLEFLAEPLAKCLIGDGRESLSSSWRWRASLAWIRSNRELVTRQAYGSFLLAEVGRRAARERDWDAFVPLLVEALRAGRPKGTDLGIYIAAWFMPRSARSLIRRLFGK